MGSISAIPVADAACDAVVCADVLETISDELEERAYRELWRVVRPGGILVVVVPAYPWLLNEEHHRAVHAVRRYTKPRLVRLMQTVPLQMQRMTYLFPTLLPLIAVVRLFQKTRRMPRGRPPRSDLRPLPRWVNAALLRIVNAERSLLRGMDFPFGSSLCAVARKPVA